jgi:hypothetical protein
MAPGFVGMEGIIIPVLQGTIPPDLRWKKTSTMWFRWYLCAGVWVVKRHLDSAGLTGG